MRGRSAYHGAIHIIRRGAAFDDILRLVREEADSVVLHSDEAGKAELLCRYKARESPSLVRATTVTNSATAAHPAKQPLA